MISFTFLAALAASAGVLGCNKKGPECEQTVATLNPSVDALNKAKPTSSKGVFLRKISVSSTMGVGVRVDAATVNGEARAPA